MNPNNNENNELEKKDFSTSNSPIINSVNSNSSSETMPDNNVNKENTNPKVIVNESDPEHYFVSQSADTKSSNNSVDNSLNKNNETISNNTPVVGNIENNISSSSENIQNLSPVNEPIHPIVGEGVSQESTNLNNANVGSANTQALKRLTKKKFYKRKIFILPIIALFLIGGAAAFYFGYWRNPNVIWSQFLSGSGIGYDKISQSLFTSTNVKYAGYKISGSLDVTDTTGHKYSASVNEMNNNLNANAGFNYTDSLNSSNNIAFNLLAFPASTGSIPDIYFKVKGTKAINSYLSNLGSGNFDKYNDQWIVLDSNFFNSVLGSNTISTSLNSKKLSVSEVDFYAFLSQLKDVNHKYLFSNGPNHILEVRNKLGFEKVNNTDTYHYKVGFNSTNVSAYYKEVVGVFLNSKLASEIETSTGVSKNTIKSSLESTKISVSNDSTVDMWINANSKVLSRLRISDKQSKGTYIDFNLTYKIGQSVIPLKILYNDSSNDTYTSLDYTLDTKSLRSNIEFNYGSNKNNSTTAKIKAKISIEPSNVKVDNPKPKNAIPLSDVLKSLGLDSSTNLLSTSSTTNSTPTVDITNTNEYIAANTISNAISDYYNNNAAEPTIDKIKITNGNISIAGSNYAIPSGVKVSILNSTTDKTYNYLNSDGLTSNSIGPNNVLIILNASCTNAAGNGFSVISDDTSSSVIYPWVPNKAVDCLSS